MRYKLLCFINYKVFKTKEGEVPPMICRVLWRILFPFNFLYEKQARVKYDMLRHTYTFNGVTFHVDSLNWLTSLAKKGDIFMFIKKEDNTITIKTLTQPVKKVESN